MTNPALPQSSPSRPKGLLATVLLWGFVVLLNWFTFYSKELLVGQILAHAAATIMWVTVLWYYWQGRNWARILILIASSVGILSLLVLGYDRATPLLIGCKDIMEGLVCAFLLVLLNRKPVRDFYIKERVRPPDRREFWVKILCICFVVSAAILSLFSLTMYWFLISDGSREWEQTTIELRAKGEKLTFKELVTAPPPDNENFFADPMWHQMYDFVSVKEGDHFVQRYRIPKEK